MKKFVSVVLVFALLLSLGASAFALDAEDTTHVAVGYDSDGNSIKQFENFSNVAFEEDIEKIVLLNDVNITASIPCNADGEPLNNSYAGILWGKTSVFDLNGHSITVEFPELTESSDPFLGRFGILVTASSDSPITIKNGSLILKNTNFSDEETVIFGNYGIFLIGDGGTLNVEGVEVTTDTTSSNIHGVGIMAPNESSISLKNSVISVGEEPIHISELDDNGSIEVISGCYANLDTDDLSNKISINSGSKTSNVEGLAEGTTVITSTDTTAMIVENGKAYLYDSLQEAITAVENGRGSTADTPATITLLKNTTGDVTLKTDTKFNISAAEGINNGATYKTEDGYEVKTDPETGSVSVEPIAVTGVTLSLTTLELTVGGDAGNLTASVQPDNASQKVTWSSDNENVATVDTNGVVTAVANGTATITATAGSYSATCTVTVKTYSSGGGSSSSSTYTVTVDSAKNGAVTVSPKNASRNTTVTITVTPDEGYELDTLTVTDASGNKLALTKKSDTQYTFTMPASRVTVSAAFKEADAESDSPSKSFADVDTSSYYYDAVEWAVENGVTNGVTATAFSPDAACTRAQMVTFLWRAAGSPTPESSVNPFEDVKSGEYYYEAVLWAVEKGIANGTSATTFSPDETVTRGQTVAFLYRYAGSPAASGGSFADVAADAYYAPAVQWAVANDITNGTSSTTFSPDAPCTRGQIVTFLYRDMAE